MAISEVFLVALLALPLRIPLLCEATPFSILDDPEVCQTAVCQESARILLDSMNTSADPCTDFYQYACGGWIEKHPIPEDEEMYAVMGAMQTEIYDVVADILSKADEEEHPKPVIDAANFFQGCIDEEAREAQGLNPLRNLLNSFGGWPMVNPEWSDAGYQWDKTVATIKRTLGINAVIGIDVDTDMSDVSRFTIYIHEPSFGLDDDHLENQTSSERTIEIVAAYKDCIIATGKLLNPDIDDTTLANDAEEIIQFGAALALLPVQKLNATTKLPWYEELTNLIERSALEASGSRKMTVSELQEATENKHFKWTDFLNNVFQDFPLVIGKTKISVYSTDYLVEAVTLAHETDPRIVANYIGWILLKNVAHYTTKDFREMAFRFNKIAYGVKEPGKLQRACVKETINALGFAVGRIYVDKYIPEEEKRDLEKVIEDVRAAFEVNLNHNSWMDDDTKNKALEKLRAMKMFLGYPEWIKNDTVLNEIYSLVDDIKKDEFFASWLKVKGSAVAMSLRMWNRMTDAITEWDNYPTEVNAFYNPYTNAIILPVGIATAPIYEYGRSPALNYAGIGSVAAHEISHGYDDSGSQRDKRGKCVDWWSRETKAKFQERTNCFRKQYSSYVEPMTNMSVNGNQTIGDNIADNGGVRNSYMAYKMQVLQAMENEVISNVRLPGISATPEQLFFLGIGTIECARYTEKSMEETIENDVHAPAAYRVNVPMSNSRAFAEAFNCPPGSRMNPVDKCQLW